MKKTIILLFIIFSTLSLYAEEAVFHLLKKDLYILSDTSYIYVNEEVKTVKEFSAKKKFSEYEIEYNSLYDSVAILKAYTINDKDTLYVTDKEIHSITSSMGEGFPDFSYLKTKVINFPAVKEGSKLYIKYALYTKRKPRNIFMFTFARINPIEKMVVNIYTTHKVHAYSINDLIFEEKEKSIEKKPPIINKTIKFKYHIKAEQVNIHPVEDNINKPPLYTFNPTLIVENTNKWEDVIKYISFEDTVSNTIWENVKKHLPEKGGNISEKLFMYIIRNFNINRDVNIINEYGQKRSVEDIFSSRYGSTYDISRLFMALLKKADISSYMALTPKDDWHFHPDSFLLKHPTLDKMGYVSVIVNIGKHQTIYNFTSPYNSKNFTGMEKPPIIVIDTANSKIVYTGIWNMGEENKEEEAYKIEINKRMKYAKITYNGKYYGINSKYIREMFMDKKGRDLEIEKEKYINDIYYGNNFPIKPLKLTNILTIDDPVIINTTVKTHGIPVYLKDKIYSIPLKPMNIPIINTSREREVPYIIRRYSNSTQRYEIKLPNKVSIVQLPQSYNVELPYLKVKQEVSVKDGRIIITRSVKTNPYTLSVDEFKKCYDKLLHIASSDRYSNIIISK